MQEGKKDVLAAASQATKKHRQFAVIAIMPPPRHCERKRSNLVVQEIASKAAQEGRNRNDDASPRLLQKLRKVEKSQ